MDLLLLFLPLLAVLGSSQRTGGIRRLGGSGSLGESGGHEGLKSLVASLARTDDSVWEPEERSLIRRILAVRGQGRGQGMERRQGRGSGRGQAGVQSLQAEVSRQIAYCCGCAKTF